MKQNHPSINDNFLYPIVFVLKEGEAIQKNFLDYSLMLLQMGQGDILRSPLNLKRLPSNSNTQLLKK